MTDITLTDMQADAIGNTKRWFNSTTPGVADQFYLSGGAGTGKTTILPDLISDLGLNVNDVQFVAPTAKAAKVMSSKLVSQFGGSSFATTIHKIIYIPSRTKIDALLKQVEMLQTFLISNMKGGNLPSEIKGTLDPVKALELVNRELDATYGDDKATMPKFMLNMDSQLREKRLIVCDEASMVGKKIATDLKSFGVPVLAIGDSNQLPPVKDTAGLTEGKPDFHLTEIHRQALDNPIIRISHEIIKGNWPQHGHYDGLVHVVEPRDDLWTDNPDYDAQVIAGTHKKRWKLTDRVRKAMGFTSDGPMKDELLVVRKNSRDHENLVNGEAVWCNKTVGYDESGELTEGYSNFDIQIESVETGQKFDISAVQGIFEEQQYHTKGKHTCSANANHFAKMKKEHLDFGWVITGHSSQGSQWPNVIVHDESSVFRNDASRWLYTAVSRAEKELILVMR